MATSPQERNSGNPRGLIGEIRMTLEEAKKKIIEKRDEAGSRARLNHDYHALGQLGAYEYCLSILSEVKDGKK